MAGLEPLLAPIDDGNLRLEQLAEAHREGLRAACAADREIWDIYPSRLIGDDFDPAFDAILANPARCPFALILDGRVIGMSGYLNIALDRQTLEIGGTYMQPDQRGTGLNRRIKQLLIARAFTAGFRRIEFRIDVRNGRSIAAVEKIGGVKEGVLRQERITWNGHVRDTALYAILADDGATVSAG
ncbi:GNAT family N-acetyltransferase [Sphingobium boeckii]|uniref:RimJ/RimL family protein N-acetyltransferase n=1 Tax=Sphingobium boeckii TaxID=1082345 RepID=A0A7W9AF64_9SPHN|nr:GNAT family protein [Sphingobium boeckii]MBB5684463.1 RimJ/RimL family protein N-acetyltransferase [Sphingobium boeckii]